MVIIPGALGDGKEIQILDLSESGAGTSVIQFSIDAESVLLSLFVASVTGSVTVTATTVGAEGQEIEIIAFPAITSATSDILLRKAASTLQRIRVTAIYTGAVTLNLRARGVSAGAASVKVEGATSFRVSQKTITTTTDTLVASSITDRTALTIVNVNELGVLWVAETEAKATPLLGAPVYASGGSLSMDLAAGSTIYATAASGTVDVRIIETAGS
jgi:hypothetical protein